MRPRTTKIFDRTQDVVEWMVIVALILGGVSLIFADPITSGSALFNLLGSKGAGIVYAVMFFVGAVGLAYGKLARRRRVHGWALMYIYLMFIFTIILETAILGWSIYSIDNIVGVLLAGACWLRWKFKTEYITLTRFERETLTRRL